MKIQSLIILILLLFLITVLSAQDSLQWTKTFPDAIDKAKTDDKIIMLNFSSEGCSWCTKLYETTFRDSNAINFLNENIIPTAINSSLQENKSIINYYRVRGFPTTIFINPDSSEIDRIIGYLPSEEFIKKANFILNNRYYFKNLINETELYPDSIDIHKELAEIYKRRGDYDKAEEIYYSIFKMIQKSIPEDSLILEIPEIQAEIAMLYYKRYQYTNTLERLIKIENEYPDYLNKNMILFNQALCLYRLNNFLKATNTLQKIINDFPKSSIKEDAEEFIKYLSTKTEEENLEKK
ncbi:MAG: thioredoxin fold domain-containing protein [Candidatus Cloacimonetes bacterium]|nr:thioredoxin fold domain-containing protein [Candidatus Cloacimonadota bacterium]